MFVTGPGSIWPNVLIACAVFTSVGLAGGALVDVFWRHSNKMVKAMA